MMIMLVDKVLEYESEKHKVQLDDQGCPYFVHLVKIHSTLKDLTDDVEILCADILHDIMEDTDTNYNDQIKEFDKPIADLVMEFTQEGDWETGYFFPRLNSRKAITVKLADRLSNLSQIDDWLSDKRQEYLRMSRFWKTEPPGDTVPSLNELIEG